MKLASGMSSGRYLDSSTKISDTGIGLPSVVNIGLSSSVAAIVEIDAARFALAAIQLEIGIWMRAVLERARDPCRLQRVRRSGAEKSLGRLFPFYNPTTAILLQRARYKG